MIKHPWLTPDTSYKPDSEPVTPYQKAEKEWDDRIGNARVQAANWRLFALSAMALALLTGSALVYMATRSSVTPYVVQINSDGIVTATGPARQMNYTPQASEIKHFLAELVTKARSLPLDPIVAANNYTDVYAFLLPAAANSMTAIMTQNDPMKKIGQETHEVAIISIIPQSKDSWQVRWRETTADKGGMVIASYKVTGLFTVVFQPPTNEKLLLKNPLGLYVSSFSWTKDITVD